MNKIQITNNIKKSMTKDCVWNFCFLELEIVCDLFIEDCDLIKD